MKPEKEQAGQKSDQRKAREAEMPKSKKNESEQQAPKKKTGSCG